MPFYAAETLCLERLEGLGYVYSPIYTRRLQRSHLFSTPSNPADSKQPQIPTRNPIHVRREGNAALRCIGSHYTAVVRTISRRRRILGSLYAGTDPVHSRGLRFALNATIA